MKKIGIVFFAAFLAAGSAMAQTMAVTNAYMYRKDGELDKARIEIDKAITNEKTMGSAKTWYFRGDIYEALAGSTKYKEFATPESMKKAFDSYTKAMELDKKNGEYYTQAQARVKAMYAPVFNKGVTKLQEKNYTEALASFDFAKILKPTDTLVYLYSGYAADGLKDFAKSKQNYRKLLEIRPKNKEAYQRLLIIAQEEEKNDAEALAITQEALKNIPNDRDFLITEVNLYLKAKRQDEAIDKLEKALSVDPKNANLYAALGSLYDGLKNSQKALDNYNKAIEIDPKNVDALFNLGSYHFNKGAELYNEKEEMSLAVYQKKGKQVEAEMNKHFAEAATIFEKALTLSPDDLDVLNALKVLYSKTGKAEEVKRIETRISEAKAKKKAAAK